MHRDIEYFIKNHQLSNEAIAAYEADLQQTLILTNTRIAVLEKKALSIQLTSVNYSDITGVKQKLTKLLVTSPSTQIEFAGHKVGFLANAIQQLKSDSSSFDDIRQKFESQLPKREINQAFKWTWKKVFLVFLILPAFIAIMADFLSKQKEQRDNKKSTVKAKKVDPFGAYKEQIFDDCMIFTTRTYPQAKMVIFGSKDVRPRKNKKGNWVTAISWKATNAFGIDVYNRTWCEFQNTTRNILNHQTETLRFER